MMLVDCYDEEMHGRNRRKMLKKTRKLDRRNAKHDGQINLKTVATTVVDKSSYDNVAHIEHAYYLNKIFLIIIIILFFLL